MQRDETAAIGHKFQERGFLIAGDFRVVCENRQRIEPSQLRWIQVRERIGVNEIDVLRRKGRPQLFETIRGAMMAIVTEE